MEILGPSTREIVTWAKHLAASNMTSESLAALVAEARPDWPEATREPDYRAVVSAVAALAAVRAGELASTVEHLAAQVEKLTAERDGQAERAARAEAALWQLQHAEADDSAAWGVRS